MEQHDWISSRDANKPTVRPKTAPRMDKEVSKILGFNVPVNNPKLIKLALKWREQRGNDDSPRLDNHLKDPEKIKELKQAFH